MKHRLGSFLYLRERLDVWRTLWLVGTSGRRRAGLRGRPMVANSHLRKVLTYSWQARMAQTLGELLRSPATPARYASPQTPLTFGSVSAVCRIIGLHRFGIFVQMARVFILCSLVGTLPSRRWPVTGVGMGVITFLLVAEILTAAVFGPFEK